VWKTGPVTNTDDTLTLTTTQQDAAGWTCQRALTVRGGVAVDVSACGYGQSDSAVTIAREIAAKVPS
jgi:hypothetical protein